MTKSKSRTTHFFIILTSPEFFRFSHIVFLMRYKSKNNLTLRQDKNTPPPHVWVSPSLGTLLVFFLIFLDTAVRQRHRQLSTPRQRRNDGVVFWVRQLSLECPVSLDHHLENDLAQHQRGQWVVGIVGNASLTMVLMTLNDLDREGKETFFSFFFMRPLKYFFVFFCFFFFFFSFCFVLFFFVFFSIFYKH